MKYAEWDELRKEFDFTPEEEIAITRKAAELLNDQELTREIAQAVAQVDAKQWGLKVPPENHPLWQVYIAYGEAALRVMKDKESISP